MILDMFKLDGKVAIVSGASRGLGQGIALAMAEAGASVVGVDVLDMDETAGKMKKLGREFLGVKTDLMNIDNIPAVIEGAKNKFGKIDICFNVAGIIRRADVLEFSVKDWDDVMNLNIRSLFFMSQAVAKEFVAQKTGGKIINIASMLSFQGGIRVPSYTTSKSGVMGVTRAMANELARHNISVNAIAPGYMATDNTAPLRADKSRADAILERIPAGRWGTPDDLMGAAVFLASKASDYVNGYTLAVDGGWLAR
ncbi:MAG: 2-dehydro-3-deoxy-D-gluconate 5-dehydrogenase KduD [Spirochaetaceae bacterium]|nr:MAG: 2-dehydro-3-deoxy-D-gluconate 5-dehydrogenase KduD [Spirochaetaceae bacterium]